MAKVVGVGGVFFKANDTKKLQQWYQDVLGIEMGEYGATFMAKDFPDAGYTAFSLFKRDSNYFDIPNKPEQQTFMVNFMVDDLFGLLIKVERAGGSIIGKPEEYEYGKFGWIADPEGNKIELWQPI